MAVPTWAQFMTPVLRVLRDGSVKRRSDLIAEVAKAEALSAADMAERLGSGATKYQNRISWAASYLTRAGALERPTVGSYRITKSGQHLLSKHPKGITGRDLRTTTDNNNEPATLVRKGMDSAVVSEASDPEVLDPIEQANRGIERIHSAVSADLLARLYGNDPTFFEHAVVKLLVAMGYGGAEGEARVTRQSNDGGIDGIIDQDTLGVSRLYIQAKRYRPDIAVGRPAIQEFYGALAGKADGGVFITTGSFSKGAIDYSCHKTRCVCGVFRFGIRMCVI